MRGDFGDVIVVPSLKRRTELLREQIADQRNASMPQRDALIEQRERRVGIAFMAGALGQTCRSHACGRHVGQGASKKKERKMKPTRAASTNAARVSR
jgi:hypothetical protein